MVCTIGLLLPHSPDRGRNTQDIKNTGASSDQAEQLLPPVFYETYPFSWGPPKIWLFTDASSKREEKIWKYQAVTPHVDTGDDILTEEEGCD